MKVIYTDEALRDLDEVLTYIALNYPSISRPFAQRLRAIEWRIGRWPKSAEEVEQRPGARVVPFIQYPHKIFYQITEEAVVMLHVHHTARQEPWERSQ